jgi:hypothetical protein
MKRILLVMCFMLTGCQIPAGWQHYITTDGRDGYQYQKPEDQYSTVIAVIFDEGNPTVINCLVEDC